VLSIAASQSDYANGVIPPAQPRPVSSCDERSRSGYVCPLDLAKVQVAVGSKERTLMYLEQSVERRCGRLVSAIVDPTFDIVRSEPRFTALRARMNLL
jgi:hypothetical protein